VRADYDELRHSAGSAISRSKLTIVESLRGLTAAIAAIATAAAATLLRPLPADMGAQIQAVALELTGDASGDADVFEAGCVLLMALTKGLLVDVADLFATNRALLAFWKTELMSDPPAELSDVELSLQVRSLTRQQRSEIAAIPICACDRLVHGGASIL
jgi:hypothetical protein